MVGVVEIELCGGVKAGEDRTGGLGVFNAY